MIPMASLIENKALVERIARELYDDYRMDMLIFSNDSTVFLLPWAHEANEYQREIFRKYAISVCKALARINTGESPRSTPQALTEFDRNVNPKISGCCG
jgi:hypothetical protein